MTLLRRIPALLLAVILALAVGIAPTPAPLLAAPTAQESTPAILGYYESEVIAGEGDAADLVVGLILYEDGSAEVISNYDDGQDIIIEVGTWVDNGDSTVTLTVTGTSEDDYAAPIELDFDVADDGSLVVPGAENGAFGDAGLILIPTELGNSNDILAQFPADARVYQSDVMPADASPGLQLTLALVDDGSLTMASDYMTEGEVVVEVGTWSEADDGSLVVTLTGQIENADGSLTEYEEPLEFTFTTNEDGSLALVDEGGALFGDTGLTLLPIETTGEVAEEGATEEEATEEATTPEATEEAATEGEATPEATEEAAGEEEATPEATEEATTEEATPEPSEEATDETTDETAETEGGEATAETAITETVVMTPSGAYVSDLLPSEDEDGTFLVTIFYENGNALVSTYPLNGDLPILERGTWGAVGDGTFVITATGTVDEEYDEPVEVAFSIDEEGTVLLSGVPLYPLEEIDLSAAPSLVAEFQSDVITTTNDFTHTITLSIYDDFSAEMVTEYLEEGELYTEYGEWDVSEDEQLIVTLTGDDDIEYDEPVEWIFDVIEGDALLLANDDEGYYGDAGLMLIPVEVDAEKMLEGATTDESAADTTAEDAASTEESAATTEDGAASTEGVQVFQSEVLPAAASPGLQLTLGLLDDGSAAIDYDYLNDEEVVTNLGAWVDNGDGTITITFTEGPTGTLEMPVELTLQLDDEGNLVITDASEESLGLLDVILAPIALE